MSKFLNESVLNEYYNRGGFNSPQKIGYMMQMIRKLKPLTCSEWQQWYMSHIHDAHYLRGLSKSFWRSIPGEHEISFREAELYMADVMFRRTFEGFCKEKKALHILQNEVSANIREASAEWDCGYFIDFYGYGEVGQLIGIQLKPESFRVGHCEEYVAINQKMEAFCRRYNAKAFILYYRQNDDNNAFFVNLEVVEEIRSLLGNKEKVA